MIEIRTGDVIHVRTTDENEKSKTKINTYEVESIPRHKRFIVCILLNPWYSSNTSNGNT